MVPLAREFRQIAHRQGCSSRCIRYAWVFNTTEGIISHRNFDSSRAPGDEHLSPRFIVKEWQWYPLVLDLWLHRGWSRLGQDIQIQDLPRQTECNPIAHKALQGKCSQGQGAYPCLRHAQAKRLWKVARSSKILDVWKQVDRAVQDT